MNIEERINQLNQEINGNESMMTELRDANREARRKISELEKIKSKLADIM